MAKSRHVHFYFCAWTNESRAWRSGTAAIEAGLADQVDYVGYRVAGLEDVQPLAPGQTIRRIGAEPARPGGSRLIRALGLPRWWRACKRDLQADGASLAVAHSLAALPAAIAFARKHRLPLMYDAHELESERQGWSWPIRRLARLVEGWLIRRCDHTIVVNQSILDWYLAAYPGLSASVVRNVPDRKAGALAPSSLRADLGIPPEALVFIYCGAISHHRGLAELVEAFRSLPADRHLVMLGDGHLAPALAERARDMPNVHLVAALPQSRLISYMSGADVGLSVLSTQSLSYYYALPNKVFEYAAAGLAICVGPGAELRRFAKDYPAAKEAQMTAQSLREVIGGWTRAELDASRGAIAAYTAPSWADEKSRLLDAIATTQERAKLRLGPNKGAR